MDQRSTSGQPPHAPGLTIGQVARRAGTTPERLRMWEARHAFPRADRLPSGHRRYPGRTVDLVRSVLALVEAGLRLERAIDQVTRGGPDGSSVFAHLREAGPHLVAQRLRKPTVTALSHAIEDEYAARAEDGVLIGAFQRARHLRPALPRWNDLARAGGAVVALCDLAGLDAVPAPELLTVDIGGHSRMTREWAVICDTPGLPVALSGWELPGQAEVPDHERRFEVVWTIEPDLVRRATLAALTTARSAGLADPGAVEQHLPGAASTAVDLVAATRLFNRLLLRLDRPRVS